MHPSGFQIHYLLVLYPYQRLHGQVVVLGAEDVVELEAEVDEGLE